MISKSGRTAHEQATQPCEHRGSPSSLALPDAISVCNVTMPHITCTRSLRLTVTRRVGRLGLHPLDVGQRGVADLDDVLLARVRGHEVEREAQALGLFAVEQDAE